MFYKQWAIAVVAVATVLVAGCSTPAHTLGEDGKTRRLSSPHSSEVTFRRVTEAARRCYPRQVVEADFFPDNRSGRVSMSAKNDLSVHALFRVDIAPAGEGTSVEVAYFAPVFADAVEKWLAGDHSACPLGYQGS